MATGSSSVRLVPDVSQSTATNICPAASANSSWISQSPPGLHLEKIYLTKFSFLDQVYVNI